MQAYSLKRTVQRLGFDCEVVNYQPPVAIEFYKSVRNRKFPKSLLHAFRNRRIQRFVNRSVNANKAQILRSSKSVFDHVENFDLVICGSDQIWNADGFRGLDETFFLGNSNLRSTKKISYAPSIGSTKPSLYERNWPICGDWLREFDAISVRDLHTKSMVEGFGLSAPELVCDPTLLPSAINDSVPSPQSSRKFLLLYGSPPIYAEQIRRLADKHRLKIISVGGRSKVADRNLVFANPKEWAALFSLSRIVVTGMFHGVQLSILNNALPFFVGPVEKKPKVFDTLSRYGLEKQWVGSPDAFSADSVEAGFERMHHVAKLRDNAASNSFAWLKSQLG
jgi:hypothetical protein